MWSYDVLPGNFELCARLLHFKDYTPNDKYKHIFANHIAVIWVNGLVIEVVVYCYFKS
jgi:hypothetical protein